MSFQSTPRLTCIHRPHVDDLRENFEAAFWCGSRHVGEEGARRCAMERRGMFGRTIVDAYEVCPDCQARPKARDACPTCEGRGTGRHVLRHVNRTIVGESHRTRSMRATMTKVVLDYGSLAWVLRVVDKAREKGRNLLAYRSRWEYASPSSYLEQVIDEKSGVLTPHLVRQDFMGRSRLLTPEDEQALDWEFQERQASP